MSFFQAIVMAVLQGVTELFPVSSLGHAVVFPALLGWAIDPSGPGFLPFLVILHLGTAVALLLFFWRDWVGLLLALVGAGERSKRAANLRLIGLIALGTVPAALAGLLLNKLIREQFAVPALAAFLLAINGVILWAGDRKHRLRASGLARDGKTLEAVTATDALMIGLAQCAALLPGISRSGATIVTGLSRKLAPDAAAHFSFLLATPVIGGAAILEIPKLLRSVRTGVVEPGFLQISIVSGVVAGIAAFLSVWFLTRYFRATEVKMMRPFALYCVIVGVAAFAWLQLR
jgi:undecaprenyl-diphosphatase